MTLLLGNPKHSCDFSVRLREKGGQVIREVLAQDHVMEGSVGLWTRLVVIFQFSD